MQGQILVLTDNIMGHTNQVLALAKALHKPFIVKQLSYNFLAKMPNSLLSYYPLHISKTDLLDITTHKAPDIILSVGRKLAIISLYLKNFYHNKPKIIHVMNPLYNHKNFDMIILPQHDIFSETGTNLVRIIGALSSIQPISFQKVKENFPQILGSIGVLIGGAVKGLTFSISDAQNLIRIMTHISLNHATHFTISFSRRTPERVKELFYQAFATPHVIFDPAQDKPNPYLAMLSVCTHIIVTSDSVSMCSEVASTGKPLYIFCPQSLRLKKHSFFCQQLFDLGVARILHDNCYTLASYHYTPLDEVTRVAEMIKERFITSDK